MLVTANTYGWAILPCLPEPATGGTDGTASPNILCRQMNHLTNISYLLCNDPPSLGGVASREVHATFFMRGRRGEVGEVRSPRRWSRIKSRSSVSAAVAGGDAGGVRLRGLARGARGAGGVGAGS